MGQSSGNKKRMEVVFYSSQGSRWFSTPDTRPQTHRDPESARRQPSVGSEGARRFGGNLRASIAQKASKELEGGKDPLRHCPLPK